MLSEIVEPNPPIDQRELASFESHHNLVLPKRYRDFLLTTNGGRPNSPAFPINGLPNNPVGVIQAFFGLNALIRSEDLDFIVTDLVARIPSGILPIARTGCDDFVCIDLRTEREAVVFWDRRPFWGENRWDENDLYPVATDFQPLLYVLHEF